MVMRRRELVFNVLRSYVLDRESVVVYIPRSSNCSYYDNCCPGIAPCLGVAHPSYSGSACRSVAASSSSHRMCLSSVLRTSAYYRSSYLLMRSQQGLQIAGMRTRMYLVDSPPSNFVNKHKTPQAMQTMLRCLLSNHDFDEDRWMQCCP